MGRDKKKQYNRIYAQNSSSINSLKRQQVYPASATIKSYTMCYDFFLSCYTLFIYIVGNNRFLH